MKRKYTDEQLQVEFYNSLSLTDLLRRLGIYNSGGSLVVVKKHLIRLGLNPEEIKNKAGIGIQKNYPYRIKIEEILVENSIYQSFKLKQRLLKAKIFEPVCKRCGLDMWLGNPIPLELEHINGVSTDNRLENLELLCPNCHALTPTYRGKNIKR